MPTLREQARELRNGGMTVPELLEESLIRIRAVDPVINSFITLADPESLRAEAKALQSEIDAGHRRGPLHGMPIGVKDVIETRALRTTGGSAALDDWIPDHDATAVARLRAAGALILGKHSTSVRSWEQYLKNTDPDAKMLGDAKDWDELDSWGSITLGSPATVREKLWRLIEQAGVGNLLIQFHFGNMRPELARKSMRLFATEVAPALRRDSAALFARDYPELGDVASMAMRA